MSALRPWKASGAIFEIRLLLKSLKRAKLHSKNNRKAEILTFFFFTYIRRNRLWATNAFVGNSTISFCSKRLKRIYKKEKKKKTTKLYNVHHFYYIFSSTYSSVVPSGK